MTVNIIERFLKSPEAARLQAEQAQEDLRRRQALVSEIREVEAGYAAQHADLARREALARRALDEAEARVAARRRALAAAERARAHASTMRDVEIARRQGALRRTASPRVADLARQLRAAAAEVRAWVVRGPGASVPESWQPPAMRGKPRHEVAVAAGRAAVHAAMTEALTALEQVALETLDAAALSARLEAIVREVERAMAAAEVTLSARLEAAVDDETAAAREAAAIATREPLRGLA